MSRNFPLHVASLAPGSEALERAVRCGFLVDDGTDAPQNYYAFCESEGRPAVIAEPLYRGCARWRVWGMMAPTGGALFTQQAVAELRRALRPEDGRVKIVDGGASLVVEDVPAHRVRYTSFRLAEAAVESCHEAGLWPTLGGGVGDAGDDYGCGGR